MRKRLLAGALTGLWAGIALGQPSADSTGRGLAAFSDSAQPERERAYIGLVDKARRQYAAAKSNDARKNARIGLQIDVHEFMGLAHHAENWIGIYEGSKRTPEGDRSIQIDIAPGVAVSTWDSAFADGQHRTLVRPYTQLARVLDGLVIGDTVSFSANLIGNVIGSDDDMVQRPRIIANFTQLKKIE